MLTNVNNPSQTSSLYPQISPSSTSVKHEHFHYHYPTKNNYHSTTTSSNNGKHPNFNGFNGLGTVEFLQKEKSPSYAVQSQPLIIENSSQFSPYKHQYKGDPYKKRILDEDIAGQDHTYFPVQPRSDDADQQSTTLQVEEEEILEDQVDADKNSRKML